MASAWISDYTNLLFLHDSVVNIRTCEYQLQFIKKWVLIYLQLRLATKYKPLITVGYRSHNSNLIPLSHHCSIQIYEHCLMLQYLFLLLPGSLLLDLVEFSEQLCGVVIIVRAVLLVLQIDIIFIMNMMLRHWWQLHQYWLSNFF